MTVVFLIVIAVLMLLVYALYRALHGARKPPTKPLVISVDHVVREKGYGTSETIVLLRQGGKSFTRKFDGVWEQVDIERAMG